MWGYFLHNVCLISNFYNLSYQKVFIPSTYPSSDNQLWGSSFHIDKFYSSNQMQIIHDGDITRTLKIKSLLFSPYRELFLSNLKVCFSNKNLCLNCSNCGKCLHSIIPIGIFDRLALSKLKTFSIDPNSYGQTLTTFLESKYADPNYVKHQAEIRRLSN